jgi:transaldolase
LPEIIRCILSKRGYKKWLYIWILQMSMMSNGPWGLGFVAGVTTNPSLVAKTGRPGLEVLKEVLSLTGGNVWYQVTADDLEGRARQAREIFALAPERIQVKIEATTENIGLAARLAKEGMSVTVTAVSSVAQAYLAKYVAPYVNRLTRQLGDGVAILHDCVEACRGSQTRIIAASLKLPEEVLAVVLAGTQDVTIPLALILSMVTHFLDQQFGIGIEMPGANVKRVPVGLDHFIQVFDDHANLRDTFIQEGQREFQFATHSLPEINRFTALRSVPLL